MSGPPRTTAADLETMKAMGITADQLAQPDSSTVELWPCIAPAFDLFCAMQTQWRTSMAGLTGMDYAALPVVTKLHGISRRALRELWPDFQHMEREALTILIDRSSGARNG
jgi:hypothetical protein